MERWNAQVEKDGDGKQWSDEERWKGGGKEGNYVEIQKEDGREMERKGRMETEDTAGMREGSTDTEVEGKKDAATSGGGRPHRQLL